MTAQATATSITPAQKKVSQKPHTTLTEKKSPFEFTPEELLVKERDWDYLSSAIYHLSRADGSASSQNTIEFLGCMLQSIKIDFSVRVPTAMIWFDTMKKQFALELNPAFFRRLTLDWRKGVLLHEIYHMTNYHLQRCPALPDPRVGNFAADFAVNQLIPSKWLPNKEPIKALLPQEHGLPLDKSLEQYYDLLMQMASESGEDGGDGEGDGGGDEDSSGGGDGEGDGKNKGSNKGKGKGLGGMSTLDVHDWNPDVDEGEVLDAIEDVVQRTMTKTCRDHTTLPQSIRDLLAHIDLRRKTISWKTELKKFIKRSATGLDKENTRTRPNKRWGYLSPGLRLSEMPKLHIYMDTSGSISIEEANGFLDEIDSILKTGMRKVEIHLWHTSLYKTIKYRKGKRDEVNKAIQAGGTDFEGPAQHIKKTKPDAVIVLTDLYWSNTKTQVDVPILFVCSHDGSSGAPTKYRQQRVIRMNPPKR